MNGFLTAIEEERRLFYVGMTRSKRVLYLCHARKRRWQGKIRPGEPSPFLRDIQQELLERSQATGRKKRRPDPDGQLELFSSNAAPIRTVSSSCSRAANGSKTP